MVKDSKPTWWQRLRNKGCTHVVYLDDLAYKRLVAWLRLTNRKRSGERRRRRRDDPKP